MAKPIPSFAEQIAAATKGQKRVSKAQELTEKFLGYWNLDQRMRAVPLPEPIREARFHPVRQWRFDLCWPEAKLAVEFHGGVWINGGHNRGRLQQDNFDKINEAQLAGWMLLQFGPNHLKDGICDTITTIQNALRQRLGSGSTS